MSPTSRVKERVKMSPTPHNPTPSSSTQTLEIDDAKKATIAKLINELQVARGVSAKTVIGSSLIVRHSPAGSGPAIISDALARQDVTTAQYNLMLESWNPLIKTLFPFDKPSPPPPPPGLPVIGPLSWPNITFDGGVPVGGWANLTLWPDGSYDFEGHFHDSGAPSYNDALAWAIKDTTTNTAYSFLHTGHMAGTFESGSRDDTWSTSGKNDALAAGWANLSAGYVWQANAAVNWDANSLVNEVIAALGIVLGVIGIVVASSLTVKDSISDMGEASRALMKLRPVKFRYTGIELDKRASPQYGLIAEEVAALYPELTIFDRNGQPSAVRYDLLPTMLLNEVQKQHSEILNQAALLADYQKELDELRAQVCTLLNNSSVD